MVTFTFSEAVTGFNNGDVTVVGGTLSTLDRRRRHGLHGDLHGDRRRRDHRLGVGDAAATPTRPATSARGDSDTVAIDTQEPDGDGGHRRWIAERRRHQLDGDVHVQRGDHRLRQCRRGGGWRHAEHAHRLDGTVYTATFTATDGFATTGSVSVTRQLHRRGRQHRRRRLRHGGDRHQEPDGDGGHRRWLAERQRHHLDGDVHVQRGDDRLRHADVAVVGGTLSTTHRRSTARSTRRPSRRLTASTTTGSVSVTRQLHRRGRQHRRGGLRHGGDRQAEPDGEGGHRRWFAERRGFEFAGDVFV